MDEHILVPFDGSPLSERALKWALDADEDADVTALYVIDPVVALYESEIKGLPAAERWAERMDERAADCCADAEAIAATVDREIRTTVIVGRPAREILQFVVAHDVDHVVMGSHGRRGVSRFILGSVAESVLRRSPVPVTVVR